MKQLHSLEFLKGVSYVYVCAQAALFSLTSLVSGVRCSIFLQLEADKRKAAIKLNSNQKRNAIVKLFKCLKKQGRYSQWICTHVLPRL